ncbi:MAG: hypothetical protein QME16_01370, partial [Planctomycetota bacterium]|nr:hypothetical protein [Planctomycetota bacterium]
HRLNQPVRVCNLWLLLYFPILQENGVTYHKDTKNTKKLRGNKLGRLTFVPLPFRVLALSLTGWWLPRPFRVVGW